MEKTAEQETAKTFQRTRMVVMAAAFAALACVATMVVKVPSPTGGYMNLGDTVVLLGGMLIGWIAGSMLVSDPTIRQLFPSAGEGTARLAGAVGALLVLFTGWRRRPRPQAKD